MSDRAKRVLITGHEIGGQMQLLAETFRRRWFRATAAAVNDDFRGYQCDIMMARQGNSLRREVDRFLFFLWAANHYDVFHFFWGVSLWDFWRFHLLDLPVLKLLRKKVVVHFRGLDVVDIRYFDWLRESARGTVSPKPPMSRSDQQKRLRKWLKYADALLVSEPDLHAVVPGAILSPQVIDIQYWQPTREPQSVQDGLVRIVHAPSSRRKKGTDFIEKSIAELKAKGLPVELVLAENLPPDKIKALYEFSDIGLDQVLYGWHGKVSVELMALGKPVVCNIAPALRAYRPSLPIVHGDPGNLTTVLEDLVRHPEKRQQIGDASQVYARRYHDVEKVADQLLEIYGFEVKTLAKEQLVGARTW
jgi:glycosyltransferase involved in cell wall biosynthesis